MKSKLVLWGTNDKDEKVLLALELRPNDKKVNIFSFPGTLVTEEFEKQLMNDWRNGKAIIMPDGYTVTERELKLTEALLPENLKVEREDLIQRAATEWQFVVLSAKLSDTYHTELKELKEKIEELGAYDSKIWENLKSFWSKVQGQVREKNLFREHADSLREGTNELFDKMKSLRKVLDKEFEELSEKNFSGFKETLGDLEDRLKKGMNLTGIFNELKKIQRSFRESKLTKEHRANVWQKLDGLFKEVKEKKFGSDANVNNTVSDRLKSRYDGLLKAIERMERSINRDRKDLDFQNKRIENTGGQLEAQIRKAKLAMIEERIRSKQEKLEDMHKTRTELEQRIEKQKAKDEKKKEQERVKQAQEEAKAKIKEEIKAAEAARAGEQDEKLTKAAQAIKGKEKAAKEEASSTTAPLQNIAASASEVSSQLKDTLEDAIDTVKAVASVVGGKVGDALQDAKEEVQEQVQELKENVQDRVEDIKESVQEQVENVKQNVQEVQQEVKAKVAEKTSSSTMEKDDLKIIEGIGPAIEEILHNVGLTSYEKLSQTSPTQLSGILLAADSKFKSKNPSTWSKQARLASEGKWDELKAWQAELDGGVDKKAQQRQEEE